MTNPSTGEPALASWTILEIRRVLLPLPGAPTMSDVSEAGLASIDSGFASIGLEAKPHGRRVVR